MDTGDLAPGTQIGRYQIVDTLGVGGSATVYRAQVQNMRQLVALKLMHEGHPEGNTESQRFAREAEVLRKLQHPHIVGLKDFGRAQDGRPYLVFAVLEGRSLKDRIAAEGPMPLAEVGKVSIQVLRALEKAHGMGIAHRDIKPDNIFLSRGVLGEMAQVLDFGLAKSATGFDGGLTKAGTVLGTPRYIAPEQARGEQVSFPADVYSFGLVMAEMITGKPVVEGTDDVQIYVQQGSDKPLSLANEVKQGPFGAIVERAIAKDPSIRYHQASQMLADVRAAADNLGSTQAPMSEAELEATAMLDPSMALKLSAPNEMSEKLRAAFNKAHKAPASPPRQHAPAAAEKPEPEPPKPSAPPTTVTTHAEVASPAQPVPAVVASTAAMTATPSPTTPPAAATAPLTPTPAPMVATAPPTPAPPPMVATAPPTPAAPTPTPARPTTRTGSRAAPLLLVVVVVLLLLLAGAAIFLMQSRKPGTQGQPVPSGSCSATQPPMA